MFTSVQRVQIIKYGGLALFVLSLLPLVRHGLFFIVLFQYYIPFAIVLYALYVSYLTIQVGDLKDQDIKNLVHALFTRKKE
jgi:hypothetical protein